MKKYLIVGLLVVVLMLFITPFARAQADNLQSVLSNLRSLLNSLQWQLLLASASVPPTSSTTQPVKITYPNGGLLFYKGTSKTFTWSSTLASSTEMYLSLVSGGATTTPTYLLGTSLNDGSESVYIAAPAGSLYKFQIKTSASSSPVYSDLSDSYFTVESMPRITLLSPNGGETWVRGSTQLVRYGYNGYIANPGSIPVYISIVNSSGYTAFSYPETGILSQGQKLVTVPTTLLPGYYRYYIQMYISEAGRWISDTSNNYLQITNQTVITPTVD